MTIGSGGKWRFAPQSIFLTGKIAQGGDLRASRGEVQLRSRMRVGKYQKLNDKMQRSKVELLGFSPE
ncbi:MAG TPA: hypothetical protein VF753_14605 [Terriglobales bacterium]